MTLRTRVSLAAGLAAAIAVGIAAIVVYAAVSSSLHDQVDRSLRERVPAILRVRLGLPERAVTVTGADVFDARATPGDVLAFMRAIPPPDLGGPGGYTQFVAQTGEAAPAPRIEIQARDRAVAAGAAAFLSTREVAGKQVRVLTAGFGPKFAVMVARPLDEVDGTLASLAFVLALVTGGAALGGGLLGRIAARPVLGPVRELSDAVDHVSTTRDLSRRIVIDGRDEVAHLGERFNGMLDALEAAEASQRRLVADASHELRTPLTSVRTNLEVLAEHGSMPVGDRERMLRDITLQVEELSGLVAGLVDLARGEQAPPAMVELRLDELAAAAVERARRHAPEIAFELHGEPVLVRGDGPRLERALANLLGNAAAWSDRPGAVEVDVRDRRLTVRDHGPGFDPADLPHIFERFYRSREARGRPGSGLGLAIVRQVADEHGATVSAANAEGGGATVTLRFG